MKMSDFSSNISEPLILELYQFWLSARADNTLPHREAFKLQSTPHKMWPYLFYYNVEGPRLYFCVHNGTEIVRYFGNETTKHYLHEFIPQEFANSVLPLYDGVVESGNPVYYRGDLAIDGERYHEYSRLLLPLSGNSGDVENIIGMMVVTGEGRSYDRPIEKNRRDIIWDDS